MAATSRRPGRHRAARGGPASRLLPDAIPLVVLVAAAAVVASFATGDPRLLKAALIGALVVALSVAWEAARRAGRLRFAVAGEAAARRSEVGALRLEVTAVRKEADELRVLAEQADQGRAALLVELTSVRELAQRLETALAVADRAAAKVRAAPVASVRSAPGRHTRPAPTEADAAWPDLDSPPTVVDLLAWEEQAAGRRAASAPEGTRRHA